MRKNYQKKENPVLTKLLEARTHSEVKARIASLKKEVKDNHWLDTRLSKYFQEKFWEKFSSYLFENPHYIKERHPLKYPARVNSVKFSPQTTSLAVTVSNRIYLKDAKSEKNSCFVGNFYITSIDFHPNKPFLFSYGQEGVEAWDINKKEYIVNSDIPEFKEIKINKYGLKGKKSKVYWAIDKKLCKARAVADITLIDYHPTKPLIAVADYHADLIIGKYSKLKVFNRDKKKIVSSFSSWPPADSKVFYHPKVIDAAFHPTREIVAVGWSDLKPQGIIHFYDLKTKEILKKFRIPRIAGTLSWVPFQAMAFDASGERFAVARYNEVWLYKSVNLKFKESFKKLSACQMLIAYYLAEAY